MNCAEIKTTMKEHSDYASAVMNLRHDSILSPIIRYKTFVESNELVKEIMAPIIEKSKTAVDLYTNDGINYEVDEIENLAILYKHLVYMSQDGFNLRQHAAQCYVIKYRNFNDMINELMKVSFFPIVQYINRKLNEMYLLCEEKERNQNQPSIQVGGDYISGNGIVQKGRNNKVKDTQNNKSVQKFEFHKGSFFLGIVASVISGLIVWGITELIKHIIGG